MSVGNNASVITNASVSTSAVLLVGARSTRDELLVQNTGASGNVFVGKDANVTATGATTGLKLAVGSNPVRFDEYNGPVWVIGDAAAQATAFEVF